MASSFKILAQAHLTSTAPTDVFTVPAAREVVVSTLVVANMTGSATTFDIALRDGGETLANKHFIAKDVPIAANDSTTLTLGITLSATDVVTCEAGAADALSFNLFGSEISV